MTPAVGDGPPVAAVKTTGFGALRLARLSKLKDSARNCKLKRSERANLFVSERSSSAKPGPCNTLRPTFPYVPGNGWTKALGLKYSPLYTESSGITPRSISRSFFSSPSA